MDKSVLITIIIVAGVLLLGVIGYSAFALTNPYSNTITGNGEASIDVVPDLVTVYFNVQTEATTSKEAKDKNSEIVDNLTTGLVLSGFNEDEIKTENFNIYPNYKYSGGTSTIIGYRATHTVKLELSTDDYNRIGDAIDAGADAGAGISYINFELTQEKQNEYKAQAIKLAAEDARIKAEALAEGLDKKVGRLVSVSSSSFDYYPWNVYSSRVAEDGGMGIDAEEAKTAATSITPSEQEISARVTAVFKIS